MSSFELDRTVRVLEWAPQQYRPGAKASVIGIITVRRGKYFESFPPGMLYTIEFEDGEAIDIHESLLEAVE